jgi:toxin ParE1/3/4
VTELIFTRPAKRDIERIAAQSDALWGPEQVDLYLLQFEQSCANVLQFPDIGVPVDYLRKAARRYQFGVHFIYYRVLENGKIRILRVLHSRMNQKDHL